MIRLRIPSGIVTLDKLKIIYELAKSKNLESINLTSRQAIQIRELSIDEICDSMKISLKSHIYTRDVGKNFSRNVSMSPLSGVDTCEDFDIEPYAIEVNKYLMNNILIDKLPKKLKVSISNNYKDTANATVADLGFLALTKYNKECFKVYLGGGLGSNAAKAIEYEEIIQAKDILYHIQAITSLFIAEGNYVNKNKARIKHIIDRLGKDEFLKCYKKYLEKVTSEFNLDLNVNHIKYCKKGKETEFSHKRLINQKQKGLYTVYFHPINGNLSLRTLKEIIDFIENREDIQIRLSMSEGMYIRNLNGDEAKAFIELTKGKGADTRLSQSMACVGALACKIGITHSQDTVKEIIDYFNDKGYQTDTLPSIYISGCKNSCATHQIAGIGFAGKKKRINSEIKEVFELYMGGRLEDGNTELGKLLGNISRENIPKFLYDLSRSIEDANLSFEEFIKDENRILNILDKYLI